MEASDVEISPPSVPVRTPFPEQVAATNGGEVSAPVRKPRGRPRKDGLPAGSPEARAADEARGRAPRPAPEVEQADPPIAQAPPPVQVPEPNGVGSEPVGVDARADPAPSVPEPRRRARAIATPIKPAEPAKTTCSDPYCTAKHPSRGGAKGAVCVETGKAIVAPLSIVEGERICKMVLGTLGGGVGLVNGVAVSAPTDAEVAMAAPPTVRMLHRAGLGEGNFSLDVILLVSVLISFTAARMREAGELRRAGA